MLQTIPRTATDDPRNSREKDSSARREYTDEYGKIPRGPSSSKPWQLSKDPRIVRVSRSFGGKDRHSKVCTVRGLRDRRVRLSVQTAIQLYDLQDRLGLNQPSKVVDWLLEAAQHDIDKLPPLQMPIENLVQFGQPMMVPHEMNPSFGAGHFSALANIKAIQSGNDNGNEEDEMKSTRPAFNWNPDARLIGDRSKQSVDKENNWLKMIEQESHEGSSHGHGAAAAIMNQSSHYRANQTTLSGFTNNVVPYASYFQWEAPPSSFVSNNSQQTEDSSSATNFPSSLSLSSGSQLLFYPASMVPSMLPSYVSTAATDLNSKHINHVQMLNPGSQNLLQNSIAASVYSISAPTMIPFQVNIASKKQVPENERDGSMSSMALTPGSFRGNPKADAGSNPSYL